MKRHRAPSTVPIQASNCLHCQDCSEMMIKSDQRRIVDIGLFAHNEANKIEAMLTRLWQQDIFRDGQFDVNVHILANGCTDATVTKAAAAAQGLSPAHFFLVDLDMGGKSRTWNTFVHDISRPGADVLIFCDADIFIPSDGMLSSFVSTLLGDDRLRAINSRPVKDLNYQTTELSPLERLIASGANTLGNWNDEICGQLYAMKPHFARSFHLPIGLPVEDGFVRAMVLTNKFSEPENFNVITGVETLFHVYQSERTIGALVRHQTRIVIGSAVNAALFRYLSRIEDASICHTLEQASRQADWLPHTLQTLLPSWPEGWVPMHYLTRRSARLLRNPRDLLTLRSAAVFIAGFGLDLVVYLRAQYKMATGTGSGYW